MLRYIVFTTIVVVMLYDYKKANPFWLVLFAFIAFVFNPFWVLHLHTKENWIAIDIVTICVFVLKIYIYSGTSSFKNYLR